MWISNEFDHEKLLWKIHTENMCLRFEWFLSTAVKLQYVHMDAITKAKTFCKQHFQMHFYEWKINSLIQIQLKLIPKDSIDELALVLVMAWSREVTKPGHYLDQW